MLFVFSNEINVSQKLRNLKITTVYIMKVQIKAPKDQSIHRLFINYSETCYFQHLYTFNTCLLSIALERTLEISTWGHLSNFNTCLLSTFNTEIWKFQFFIPVYFQQSINANQKLSFGTKICLEKRERKKIHVFFFRIQTSFYMFLQKKFSAIFEIFWV